MCDEANKLWYIQTPRAFGKTMYEQFNIYKWSLGSDENMSKVSPVLDALLDEDTRALVDAGFLDGSLYVAGRGNDALQRILFEQNKAALVVAAKEQLAKEAKK